MCGTAGDAWIYTFYGDVPFPSNVPHGKEVTFLIISIGAAVFIYWIFRGFFNLMLPAGLLG